MGNSCMSTKSMDQKKHMDNIKWYNNRIIQRDKIKMEKTRKR